MLVKNDNDNKRTTNNVVISNNDNNTATTTTTSSSTLLLERKIAITTEGQLDYVAKRLRTLKTKENIETVCNYIIAMNMEINPSLGYKKNQILVLCQLAEFYHNNNHHYRNNNNDDNNQNNNNVFLKMTRNDILAYLDSLRKPESSDPYHKWIGTYKLRRIYFLKFFKWLYNPDLNPKDRPTPDVMKGITRLKRKEHSTIKPTDLWTTEDDLLFLRYCPSKRDKAYHIVARDTSCRPDEILRLRIRDVVFKTSGTSQYAEVMVSGKTGNRPIPLIASVPYVKDWIDNHPQRMNPNTFLIPSLDRRYKRFGNKMKEISLNILYRNYKLTFFPALLEDPKVVPEDKKKIKELLKKPWNPYIFRHSALTAKSKFLKENTLRQHAGWSKNSDMPKVYVHYFGDEANQIILTECGIVTEANKGNVLLPDSLRPRLCPNCNEPNIPNCKFCAHCRMVLTFDAYEETIEEQKKKDDMLEQMRREQLEFQQRYQREREEQMRAQERNQELLEALWLHQQQQQQQEQRQEQEQDQKQQEEQHQQHPINKNVVNRHIVYRRNEVGVPPTPWIQTFVLNDPRKSDEENNKNITNSMFDKNNIEVSWRHLPGITNEQEEKWHNNLMEGLNKKEKEEQEEKRKKSKNKRKRSN